MAESKRGAALTVLSVLFFLLAISDYLKPFHLEGSTTGLVFFGTRLSGVPNAILGPVFGVILVVYAVGIWSMRRWALYLGYGYAAYVTLNLFLYVMKHPNQTHGELVFGIVYTIVALVLTWGTAIMLTRRRAELA